MVLLEKYGLFLLLVNLAFADFRNDALNVHNELRRRHDSPPLSLSNELNNFAQDFAQKLANEDKFEHSGGKCGENLHMVIGVSSDYPESEFAMNGVNSWYNEESKYNYDNPGFSLQTGHFTAVVWKNTKSLGIGVARRGNKAILVASYDPPGNFGGQFRENVLRPNSGGSNCAPEDYLRWITKDEAVPAGFSPLYGGLDVDSQVQGICTAKHSGDLIPGKFVRGSCYVSYGGAEHKYDNAYRYAVFRKVDGCPALNWVTTPSKFNGGVPGGKTAGGEILFVSRYPLPEFGPNVIVPGKIHENDKSKAYYPFSGQERICTNYDVLMIA